MSLNQAAMSADKHPQKPTARLLTPLGTGAVATIQIQGNLEALEQFAVEHGIRFFVARNGQSIINQPLQQILYGRWGNEQLVACRVAQQQMEIHAHGGMAAASRILADLQALQVSVLKWDDPAGLCETDLEFWQLDYQHQIAHAPTLKTARWLLQQSKHGPAFWKARADDLQRAGKLEHSPLLLAQLLEAERWANFGKHLTTPYQVVIAGIPNAGKSSLLNRLLGFERAIISSIPGTTRDIVMQQSAFAGWSVQLQDTAGHREQAVAVEAAGIELARAALAAADLILLVVDARLPPDPISLKLQLEFPDSLLVFNKIDLGIHGEWQQQENFRSVQVSCKTAAGMSQLVEMIGNRLVPKVPEQAVIFPVSEHQHNLMNRIRQMLPSD